MVSKTKEKPAEKSANAFETHRLKDIHIGTSGWEYKHWSGNFYPEKMQADEHLAFYCRHFHTVEINNTFYQLPTEKKLTTWHEIIRTEGPADFKFAVKGSRFTTHMKKLKDPEQNAGRFFEAIVHLKEMLGPVLFQLPPRWHSNPERLDSFLEGLPKEHQYTFELRDESWLNSEVDEVLKKHQAGFCIYEIAGRQSPLKVTSDLVYIRLHGPEKTAYTGQYDKRQLKEWADRMIMWQRQGRQIYCYFDNDQKGYAAEDARRLIEIVQAKLAEK